MKDEIAPPMDSLRKNSWTVLIYTSASHDLEKAVQESLEEITEQGTPQDVHVVAQMGIQGEARRYQLHGVKAPELLQPAHPAEMTEPRELSEFLRWGMQKYPAQHYAVVLGGHGAGFAGAVTDTQRRRMIPLPDLEKSLGELPRKPDLVVFNTCLMAQAEVASQLQPVTDHLVASQSELLGLGLPLAPWLNQLPQLEDGGAAAERLVEVSRGLGHRAPAVASIDLRGAGELRQELDGLAGAILEHPQTYSTLRQHVQNQPHLWPRAQDRPLVDQIDLLGLCRAWQGDLSLPRDLREQAGEVMNTVARLCRSSEELGGLSIYAPERDNGAFVQQIYTRLRFAEQTRWDEALQALHH